MDTVGRRIVAIFFCLLFSASLACSQGDRVFTKQKVESDISNGLHVGSSREEIECFFKLYEKKVPEGYRFSFGWNEFSTEYEGVIRRVGSFDGVTFRIVVDSDRSFMRADVDDAFTMP